MTSPTWTPAMHSAARELSEKATPGPWRKREIEDSDYEDGICSRGMEDVNGKGLNKGEDIEKFDAADVDFIVSARSALPLVLDRIEALEKQLRIESTVKAGAIMGVMDQQAALAAKDAEIARLKARVARLEEQKEHDPYDDL